MAQVMNAVVLEKNKVRFSRTQPRPTPPQGEALIRVTSVGVCSTDLELVKGYMNFSGVIGHEFVGVVEQADDAQWVGARVVGEINCVCGKCDMCQSGLRSHCRERTVLGIAGRDGAFAEYLTLPQRNLHRVPEEVTDEQAVFCEPLAAALQVIKQVPIDSRMRATVLGDGRLGLLVAQVLQSTGCELRIVGRHANKLSFADKRSIRTVLADDLRPDNTDDVVVDCTGSPGGLETALRLVRPRGIVVLKSTYAVGEPVNLAPLVVNEVQMIGSRCGPLAEALDLLRRGEVDVAGLVTRRFKFDKMLDALDAARRPENIKVVVTI